MKLLSLVLNEHDDNFSYFDGNKVHYCKSERNKQIKHHSYTDPAEIVKDIKELWGIEPADLDDIAVAVDSYTYNLPLEEQFFPTSTVNIPAFSNQPIIRLNHHYAHALSYWPITNKKIDISFVIDGYGEPDNSFTVFKNNKIIDRGILSEHGSIGTLYSLVGHELFNIKGNPNDVPGKLMGMQSYGTLDMEFLDIISKFSVYETKKIFDFDLWIKYKGDRSIAHLTKLDWIRTVHHHVGYALVDFFKKFASPTDTIFYSGGVAQNVIWNTLLKQHFPNLIIAPHSSDEGVSLGVLEYLRLKHNLPSLSLPNFPFSQTDQSPKLLPSVATIKKAAKLLATGYTVAWYQGHGEVGPRALGNRSILMDPRMVGGKDHINKIKKREGYRPFGAVVLDEYKEKYFEVDHTFDNPHMLYIANLRVDGLDCITHIDGTCRIQTLKDENPVLRQLMEAFYALTGCPILLNTSLNINGKPIMASYNDAMEFFMSSNLDCLAVGDDIICKH